MNSEDLTTAQAEEMRDRLNAMRSYLNAMAKRMEMRRFPASDPLFRKTLEAKGAMQTLWMELHYLSCKSGVGRAARER